VAQHLNLALVRVSNRQRTNTLARTAAEEDRNNLQSARNDKYDDPRFAWAGRSANVKGQACRAGAQREKENARPAPSAAR
jgi:hypothetical protein